MSVIVLLKICLNLDSQLHLITVHTGIQDQSKLIAYSFKFDGAISESALYQDQHAFHLSNRTLYLLNILQQLPISKMNHLNIQQDILNEMSELLIMLYREYAGMF